LSGPARIRPAERTDVPVLLEFVRELAHYERAAERVIGTESMLADALFGERPAAEAVVAEVAGEPAGFALFFTTFSTWLCQRGIYLEDLFVRPEHRRGGVGRQLLAHLARLAVERGCGRLEWAALTWNTPALDFYAALGAERLEEWAAHRLEGLALERVAVGLVTDQ
jgi:GNAT superfamily N-acetyltransferase